MSDRPAPRPHSALATDARVLLAATVAAAAALGLLKLASGLATGEPSAFDRMILLWLRGATEGQAGWQSTLRALMLDLTSLGNPLTLTLVVVIATGFLLAAQKARLALLLAASTGLGALTGSLLKLLVGRPRPDVVHHLVETSSLSFPSGHAMHSAIVYLTLTAMIARADERPRVRAYVTGAGAVLVLLIGLSRLYLGVHWPTDVLAGWLIGAAWASGAAIVARRLQTQHRIEPPA